MFYYKNVFFFIEKLDDLFSIVREIQISVDDSTLSLEQYRNKILESEDLIKKLNLFHDEIKYNNNIEAKTELNFNQVF